MVGLPVNEHRVELRDTLWSIASDRLGSPLRWKEIAELNYNLRQPDGGALTAEHWIRPGWTLQLPEPIGGDGPVKVDRPYWAQVGPEALKSVDRTDGSPGHSSGPTAPIAPKAPIVPLMPVGAGVVGAGVVDLLERMRQVQQRHRADGNYIRLPGRSHSQFEQRLRLGGGAEIAHAVDCAIHLFVRGGSGPQWGRPTVTGVTVGADTLQLTTDGTVSVEDLANPFVPGPDGSSIVVDRALLPSSATGRRTTPGPPPAPLLVTAGQGSDGLIMVNLESLGTLIVGGDPSGSEGVIRALSLELATSLWNGWFDLVVVGFGAELERFDRVMAVPDLPPLLESLYRRRLHGIELLRTTGLHSFAQARCVDDSDDWDPIVVVCGPTVSGEYLSELLELGSDPHLGVAVVAVGETGGSPDGLSLSGRPQPDSMDLLGSVVVPQQLEAAELDGVTALMDTAGSRQSVLLSEEPYVNISVPMPMRPTPTPADRRDPPSSLTSPPSQGPEEWPIRRRSTDRISSPGRHTRTRSASIDVETATGSGAGRAPAQGGATDSGAEVEVLVLGQIGIRGATREFTRAWAKELVVFLAMHPHGASTEAWATALWPDRLMAPSSLHSTASVARRALGQARNGVDHLPRSHGRLALSDTVTTDWNRFVIHADSDDPAEWRRALDLVRGRPFEGIRSSDWPILEGIGPAIEAAVVDLSGRLAGSCLEADDPRGAEWAARQGLLVSPYDERLYRTLMRAADLSGNPAGVESAMSELVRLVADDIEPLDSVHPSTMDLYRSLTRGRHVSSRLR